MRGLACSVVLMTNLRRVKRIYQQTLSEIAIKIFCVSGYRFNRIRKTFQK